MWKTKTTTQSTSDVSTKHRKFIWEHHIWCHVRSGNTGINDPEPGLPGSHKQKRPDQPLKKAKQHRKKPNTR